MVVNGTSYRSELAVRVQAKLDEAYREQYDDLVNKQEKWYQEQSKYLKRMWETRDDVRIPIPKKQKMKFGLLLELRIGGLPSRGKAGCLQGQNRRQGPEDYARRRIRVLR